MMTKRNSWDSYSDPSVVRVSSFGQRTLKLCNRADTLYSDQFFWASRVQKLGVSSFSLFGPHSAVPVLIANLLRHRLV